MPTAYDGPSTLSSRSADCYAIRINDEFTVDVMPAIAGQSWDDMQRQDQMEATVISEA